jgi:hypothetical protein
VQLALTRHGFSLADIRGLTAPEAKTYIELLAEAASGKTGNGQRIVNQRLKKRRG